MTAMSRLEGRPVVRSPEQLRVHRALYELDLMDVAGGLNDAARLRDLFPPEPILITKNGTILVGLGRWRLALLDGRQSINCIQYVVNEEPAIEFMLAQQQPRQGWHAFVL